jgi:anti-sigma regulatory factor (Ser/Thr protein kinase)
MRAHDLEAAAHTASLVVSELVTNAVVHARTPLEVRVLVAGDRVRIEVHDQTAGQPRRRSPTTHATGGRGLRMVEALCHAWGVETDADGAGKTVWAEVAVSPRTRPGRTHGRQAPDRS